MINVISGLLWVMVIHLMRTLANILIEFWIIFVISVVWSLVWHFVSLVVLNDDEDELLLWKGQSTKSLTLSWRKSLLYRNQSTDLLCKSIDWFLYDKNLLRERFKLYFLPELLPEVLNISNLQEFESRICIYTEPELRLCWLTCSLTIATMPVRWNYALLKS